MPDERLCPVCGVAVLPARYRKCDDCLASKPAAKEAAYVPPRDVELDCGHLVTTDLPVGRQTRCPLHRRQVFVVDVYTGGYE